MGEHAMNVAGVDLGDRYSYVCILEEDGAIVEESRIPTSREGVQRYFATRGAMKVVLEVGAHSPWTSRLIEELGHDAVVANARRIRLIAESDQKDDRSDAELLARLGRADLELLAPVQHRSAQTQADMSRIRAREALVRSRTLLINSVRGLVKTAGGRMPRCSADHFGRLSEVIPEDLRDALTPTMTCIAKMTTEIKALTKQIEKMANDKYPEAQLLAQVDGVGPITAMTFVLTIEDPKRFSSSRTVGAFVGLTQKKRKSSESDPQLGITKSGNPYLRRLLVGNAQYILGPFGPDSDLRRWGLRIAERGGKNAKKRAAVAVARKLAVILHRLWATGDTYERFPRGKREAAAA